MADFNDINIGTVANDRTGDKPRDVGSKINTAWAKLRSFFTDIANGTKIAGLNAEFLNGIGITATAGYVPFVSGGNLANSNVFQDLFERIGINNVEPRAPISICKGINTPYPTLGTAGGSTTIGGDGTNYGLDIGVTNTDGNTWLQVHRFDGVATAYNLILQPSGGNAGIGTTQPTAKIDINSDILRLRTSKTPSSATATGNTGDIAWDANYIYVCVATNTWKRTAISTW